MARRRGRGALSCRATLLAGWQLLGAASLSVHVLPNGGSGDGQLVKVPLPPSAGTALSAALSAHLSWVERGEEPFFVSERAVVFASNRGNLDASAMHQALQEGERLFVVPRHRQFIHPADQLGRQVELAARGAGGRPIVLTTLASQPRIFHISNLLEQEHMDALMDEARPNFRRSTVGDAPDASKGIHVGGELFDIAAKVSTRTSENAWAMTSESAMTMKRRSLEVLGMQTQTGAYDERLADGLQVVRYLQGQAYHDHMDFMQDADPLWNYNPYTNGSNRLATVFLYMSDPGLGGQTVFPRGERVLTNTSQRMLTASSPLSGEELTKAMESSLGTSGWEHTMSRKCFEKLAVFPRRGDAIVFYSQRADGKSDPDSLHGGCPVLNGEKWAANLWVWNGPRKGTVHVDNNMALTFSLSPGVDLSARIYWVPSDGREKVLIGEVRPGDRFMRTKTFHSHRFDVFVLEKGEPERRIGSVVANKVRGHVQNWLVSAQGLTPEDGGPLSTHRSQTDEL